MQANRKQAALTLVTGLLYLAVGVSSLVVSLQNPDPRVCGFDGQPPLRQWVFGTGIGYSVMGLTHLLSSFCLCSLFCLLLGAIPVILVLLLGGVFTFAWTIVGSVSLWRDGADCRGRGEKFISGDSNRMRVLMLLSLLRYCVSNLGCRDIWNCSFVCHYYSGLLRLESDKSSACKICRNGGEINFLIL